MDIIDVDDVLGDDSFIGDTERLDDEVEEILKQWKSSSTFPSSSDGATSSGSSNSVVPTVAVGSPAAAPAAASNSFGFGSGTNHHHHQHLYSNSSSSSGNGYGHNNNNSFNSDSKGLKYIDTRTFTRPKKKLDSTFNASGGNVSAELVPGTHEHTIKMSSPLLNLQIGGPVTLSPTPTANSSALGSSQLMQKSWLNDVSPPGSIMSSMEFSVNEKLGSSLITSGDFTNVSYLLNGANGIGVSGDESTLNSHSSYDGYRLADVIKDRKFLENLSSCFDENTMTKDCAISRTDLNGIEEAALSGSGFSTMQSSLESVTAKVASGDATMVLESGKADATFELEPTTVAAPTTVVRERLNGTFERRRNFDTYRKPKSSLNSTFDALPKVDVGEPIPVANKTFDAGTDGDNLLDATFGVTPTDNCNGTFSLNRTARVNGAEKQLNQTYEYCEKSSPAVADRTFEARQNGTFVEDMGSPANRTPNGTFELPAADRLTEGVDMLQSTPFVQVPRAKRVSGISEYEVNCSPIAAAPRRSEGVRRSRNLEQDMSASHLETDDFDVEFRKLPITPNAKTESGGSHLLDNNEKRISLQHFEEFEKSIMESEHNGLDFDEMLNSLTSDVRKATDSSVKLRQSLDNIKKRHSRINTEKQQQEQEQLRKRGTTELNDSTPSVASPLDNKLADSMIRSMSSSGGSERLLNRRSRYNDDVHLTLSPQQQQLQKSVTEQQQQEVETNESNRTATEMNADPAPTAPEVGGSDKKNRDRFKTIRISKRREEGMVVVDPDDDDGFAAAESAALPMEEELPGSPAPTAISSAFGRVDYNSPKESRLAAEQNKTEDAAVFKRPQLVGGIPKAESKIRSLSKPRSYYGITPSAGGFGLRPKDLSLPLSAKSSSTDNLENDRPNYQQPPAPGRLSLGGKLGGSGGVALNSRGPAVQSNLKSPMGTKSKSHHNLYFNQSGSLGGSNSSLHRIPTGSLGLSAQKLSHNNSNTELSGVQMRAPKAANASRLGLVRPSSGYFSYSSHKKVVDSDTESINSLSSSSASSRGSLYRVDSQTIANNVQTGGSAPSAEDISLGLKASLMEQPNRTTTGLKAPSAVTTAPKPSGLRPPSNLRPPTARSGLPRPTSFVRR